MAFTRRIVPNASIYGDPTNMARTGKGAKTRKLQKLEAKITNFKSATYTKHVNETGQDEEINVTDGGVAIAEDGAELDEKKVVAVVLDRADEDERVARTNEVRDEDKPS